MADSSSKSWIRAQERAVRRQDGDRIRQRIERIERKNCGRLRHALIKRAAG
jgi:hypothetical protein